MSKKVMSMIEAQANNVIRQVLPLFSTTVVAAIQEGKLVNNCLGLVGNAIELGRITDVLLQDMHLNAHVSMRVQSVLHEEAHALLEDLQGRYTFCSEWHNEQTPGYLDEIYLDNWTGHRVLFNNGQLLSNW